MPRYHRGFGVSCRLSLGAELGVVLCPLDASDPGKSDSGPKFGGGNGFTCDKGFATGRGSGDVASAESRGISADAAKDSGDSDGGGIDDFSIRSPDRSPGRSTDGSADGLLGPLFTRSGIGSVLAELD